MAVVQCRGEKRRSPDRTPKGTSGSVQQRSIRRAPSGAGLLSRWQARRIDLSSFGQRDGVSHRLHRKGWAMGGERKVLWIVLIVAGVLLGLPVLGMVLAYFGLWERFFR